MKKFLLMAAIAMAATCTMYAGGDEDPGAKCESCGDESATSTAIQVYASVRVPLSAWVADASLTFPCIRRGQTYTVDATTSHVHSGNSGTLQNTGATALVEFYGDENDVIQVSASTNTVLLSHVNTECEYSDGVQNDNTMTMVYNYWSRAGKPTTNTGPSLGPGPWSSSSWGGFTLALVKLGNGPDPTAGTGENDFWVGGTITASATQQRGCYRGSFTLHADYCP